MKVGRTLALALGTAAALAGVLFVVQPALVAGLDVGRALLLALSVVAVLYGLRELGSRYRSERRLAASPHPEVVPGRPTPGDDFDDLLAAARRPRRRGSSARRRVRRRLEAAAVAAVRRRHGWDRETARRRLEDGTWTDDPVAATYFADREADVRLDDAPLTDRVRMRLFPGSRSGYQARRVAAVVAELAGVEGEP